MRNSYVSTLCPRHMPLLVHFWARQSEPFALPWLSDLRLPSLISFGVVPCIVRYWHQNHVLVISGLSLCSDLTLDTIERRRCKYLESEIVCDCIITEMIARAIQETLAAWLLQRNTLLYPATQSENLFPSPCYPTAEERHHVLLTHTCCNMLCNVGAALQHVAHHMIHRANTGTCTPII